MTQATYMIRLPERDRLGLTTMDSEARVYAVLLIVMAVVVVGLLLSTVRSTVEVSRAHASARMARNAAIVAASERDALRKVLADLRRRDAIASPTVLMPLANGGKVDTGLVP